MNSAFEPRQIQEVLQKEIPFQPFQALKEGLKLYSRNPAEYSVFILIKISLWAAGVFVPLGYLALIFLVNPSLNAGFYLYCHDHAGQRQPAFSRFFSGFDYFNSLTLSGLWATLPAVLVFGAPLGWLLYRWDQTAATLPDNVLGMENQIIVDFFQNPAFIQLAAGAGVAFLAVTTFYLFTPFFLVFFRLKPWAALEASRRLVARRWLPAFVFTLSCLALNLLGLCLLGVGVLLTLPVTFCATYMLFVKIFAPNSSVHGLA